MTPARPCGKARCPQVSVGVGEMGPAIRRSSSARRAAFVSTSSSTGRGVISVAAEDGKPLWSYNKVANGTANIPTPIVKDDLVFCSSGYDTGAALLRVVKKDGKLQAEEVYFLPHNEMQNHHGGMILLGDHIYCGHGHNQGYPLCVEMKSGKVALAPGGLAAGRPPSPAPTGTCISATMTA